MYTEMTVKEFLEELASDSPAPGGGSVSALAGSMAASLVAMVARFTAGRGGSEDREEQVKSKLDQSIRLQHALQKDVDGDTAAYNRVVEAYRMPKERPEQKEARSRAIQKALREATQLPLQVAKSCLEVLLLCRWAVREGNPNTWSDAVTALVLAQSGIRGALANVAINLGGIKDAGFKEGMRVRAEEISVETERLLVEMGDLLYKPLA